MYSTTRLCIKGIREDETIVVKSPAKVEAIEDQKCEEPDECLATEKTFFCCEKVKEAVKASYTKYQYAFRPGETCENKKNG